MGLVASELKATETAFDSPIFMTSHFSIRQLHLITIAGTLALTSGCVAAPIPDAAFPTTGPIPQEVAPIAGDIFVAPDGVATNSGAQEAPTTLENALAKIAPGHTIWLRGGTYPFVQGISIALGNDGTASAPKRIFAYNDEMPIFDFSAQTVANNNRGLTLNGNFWHLKGLIVERAGDNGIYVGGSDNVIELCVTRFNADSGLQISRANPKFTDIAQWPSRNLILNCTSHDNKDPGNENADGFACKLTAGVGNVFRGCIAHHNIDDGWDFYAKTATGPIGPVLIENCVAYNNGTLSDGTSSGGGDKNGFKLGGSGIAVAHTIRNSVSFGNGKHGFTDNNNPGPIAVSNNIGFHNGETNFNFRKGGVHVFTGNISVSPAQSDKFVGTLTGDTNVFWDKKKGSTNNGETLTVSDADFVSVVPPAIVGRRADGSPDLGDFLRLKPDSALIKMRDAERASQ